MSNATPPAPGRAEGHEWKLYRRLGEIEARPYQHGDQAVSSISISEADLRLNTLVGGYVARNPDNHADQWYIAPDYFAKHYAPISRPAPAIVAEVGDVGELIAGIESSLNVARRNARGDEVKCYERVIAALRTLAEVRGEADHARDVCRVMERDLKAQRDAATQRAEQAEAALAELQKLHAELGKKNEASLSALIDARKFRAIRELLGYVEDGSSVAVAISQDDATRSWCVSVGKKNHYAPCLSQALDAALERNRAALPAPATNATGEDSSLRADVVANT